jgi:diacylglycerol O-acyltransferase / wax synthase
VLQLNQQDAGFLYAESPRVPMHLSSIHTYDMSTAPRPIVFEDFLEHVRRRLPLARILRRKLVRVPLDLDYPYWVEDDVFDLEFHVRRHALPSPGDWQQLWDQMSRLHAQPLDLTRPPWELYFIEGLDAATFGEHAIAMFIKIHHSAIDGISGIELMNALHDLEPHGRAEVPDTWQSEPEPTRSDLLLRTGTSMALAPLRAWRLMTKAMPQLPMIGEQLRSAQQTSRPPVSVLNAKVTTNRVGDGFRFELAAAKAIRSAVPGATVNDVVLTVVGGGLRRYLTSRAELPDEPLVAGVPVSLRTDSDAGVAGNKISMMMVPLGTDIASPLQRLGAVHDATAASKERTTAVAARTLAESGELFPGALLGTSMRALPAWAGGRMAALTGNVCVTNVPGSQVPLYLCGARMDAYYGMGPVYDYAGPIHLVVSYLGQIHLSVTTCREIMPDIGEYIDCLRHDFEELASAAEAATSPAPVRPSRRRAKKA